MKIFIIKIISFYQKWISPMFPARCKYYPSCSTYTINAISKHGMTGILMAAWRLLRCNPWSHGGVDYVPNNSFLTFNSLKHLPSKLRKGVSL